jgi:hypothetical protein
MLRVVFALLVSVLSLAEPADALVMCAKAGDNGSPRSGAAIRLRDTCRALEVQVDPVALGLQGPPGPPDRGAVARDANDAIIGSAGTLLLPDPNEELRGVQVVVATPLLSGQPTPIVVSVGTKGFVSKWDAPGQIFFESADCSGPAYWVEANGFYPPFGNDGPVRDAKIIGPVVDGSYYFDPSVTVAGDGIVAYVADGLPTSINVLSTADSIPASECADWGLVLPNGACCSVTGATMLAQPAVAVDVAAFVPPFRVDAR